jgi:type II secretory pathway component GspD/PulD (secretin)
MNVTRRALWRSFATVVGGCLLAVIAWAQSLQVIDLKYRTAQEVIPVLQPLLEPGAALSGQNYQLFVRTSSANLAQLRAALAQLDRQPRQLFVSVRQSTEQEIERERAAVSGTLRTGDGGVSVNERPRADSGVTVHATDSTTRTQGGSVASVQVIEGNSAFIATGSSVPIVTSVAGGGGRRRPWAASSTSYRDLSSGFMVTPRVNGQQVVLDIEQQDERVDNGNIQTQHLTTQVSGPLGEWIQLGGVGESAESSRSGILNRQYSTRSDGRSIWVKVEAR